jgi:hypothetical protein
MEITGLRKLLNENEELICTLPNITRVKKSGRMKWACMVKMRNANRVKET